MRHQQTHPERTDDPTTAQAAGYDQPPTDRIPRLGEQHGAHAQRTSAGERVEAGTQVEPPGTPVERPSDPADRPDYPADQSVRQAGGPYGTPPPSSGEPGPDPDLDPVRDDDTARRGPESQDPVPQDREAQDREVQDREATMAGGPIDETGVELFGGEQVELFRGRWREIQADFVDDPRQAVRGADDLVGEVIETLTSTFAQHKQELESQWQRDGDAGETEQLRLALRRYRSFFDQLLNT